MRQRHKIVLGTILSFMAASLLWATPPSSPPSPQRIASGTVGSDEILFELLASRQELHRLIAVSIFSEDPRYSHLGRIPPSIKGRVGNSLESLLVLKPDLAILASYNRDELSRELQRAGVQVAIQEQFRSLEDVLQNIAQIGRLIGATREADLLIKRYRERLKALADKRQTCSPERTPTILQFSEYDTLSGSETTFDDAARHAGFVNLAAQKGLKGWTTINQEVLVSFNPDWIVAAGEPHQASQVVASIQSRPAWKRLRAVQDKRILVIPERLLSSVSHHTLRLVETLSTHHSCREPKK